MLGSPGHQLHKKFLIKYALEDGSILAQCRIEKILVL